MHTLVHKRTLARCERARRYIDVQWCTIARQNKSLTHKKATTLTTASATAYAALAPSALVVSLSTLALSAMPVQHCTAMATLWSR